METKRHLVWTSSGPSLCGLPAREVVRQVNSGEYHLALDCTDCKEAAARDTRERYGIPEPTPEVSPS